MDSTSSSHEPIAGNATQQLLQHSGPSGQLPQQHPGVESVDASLSSIVAFNQSYNSHQPAAPNNPISPNQWGKRPAEHSASGDATKRQHLDGAHVATTGLTPEEVEVHNQLQAHIASAGSVYRLPQQQQAYRDEDEGAVHEEDDDENDPDFEVDEDEQDQDQRDQDRMNAMIAAQAANPWLNLMDANTYALWDANQNLRIHSLPILDNLSSQILQTLGKGPYTDTLNIVTQPDSDQGQAYNTMKSLFDQTKKLYTHEAFLSADDLKLDTPDQRSTIRKVNLATFVSSVFGSQEVGFFHLNEHFLDTFVPDGGRLLKSQGSLYLDLKTQAYISAMSTNERSKEEILEDLFPANMGHILLARRPGAKQLTPSEQDFVGRLTHRRNHLMQIVDDVNLSDKYVWQDFLQEVSSYVSKNHETIVAQPARKARKRVSHENGTRPDMPGPSIHPQSMPPVMNHHQSTPPLSSSEDANTAAILQAHASSHPNPPHTPPNRVQQSAAEVALDTELFGPNTTYMGAPPLAQPPIPQQSQPTQVLYERARLAATSKASPNARRAGLPSQRRPWTTEEENALMAGLDRVKGPHWSQILAMFGPGGTLSEALKDRNQVQLKDKARNLKLFFLKSGIEVPYYLQFVTGELKTRAPGQAAKNAAKKAVEASAEEDAAHVAAVTALGNAHRDSSHDLAAFHSMGDAGASPELSQQEGSEHGSVPPQPQADIDLQVPGLFVGNSPPTKEQVAPQAPVAPMAPMGSGMSPQPQTEPQQQEGQQQQQQQQQQEQPQIHQLQQPQKPPTEGDESDTEIVDPSLVGVDPQLRTAMVGHEVSAERGT